MTTALDAIGGFMLRIEPVVCLTVALALDLAAGEPPESVHPVAVFGRGVAVLDREWRAPRLVGVAIALLAPLTAATIVRWGIEIATHATLVGPVLAGFLLFSTLSLRRLLVRARDVVDASASDVALARETLPALAGRDPTTLSPGLLRSATVESAAENLADGFLAPLLAFVAGSHLSVSVGVAAAVWVKAVNTLDSMLGYREKPVGWASARLDDLVMWLPARLSALAIAIAAREPGALRRARRWHDAAPSPNSGWPMATLAAVLDVRLEKPGAYVLNPEGSLPDRATARRSIRLVALAGGVASVVALALAGVATC